MKMGKQYWSSHVAAAKAQGIAIRAYAKRHGLALSTLYYWQRKLRLEITTRTKAETASTTKPSAKFVALRIIEPECVVRQAPANCTLILTGGMRLEMAALPDPQWLAALGRCTQGAH